MFSFSPMWSLYIWNLQIQQRPSLLRLGQVCLVLPWHCGARTACHRAYLKDISSVRQLGLISSLAFLISRSVNQLGNCSSQPPRSLLSRLKDLVPVWLVESGDCVCLTRTVGPAPAFSLRSPKQDLLPICIHTIVYESE